MERAAVNTGRWLRQTVFIASSSNDSSCPDSSVAVQVDCYHRLSADTSYGYSREEMMDGWALLIL